MIAWQNQCPLGKSEPQLLDRKLTEHKRENLAYILAVEVGTAYKGNGHTVLFFKLHCQSLCLVASGTSGVEHYRKGLAEFFYFTRNSFLCLYVALSRNIRDASVGCHQHTDRRVLADNLACAKLRRLGKGHSHVAPRSHDHSLNSVLLRAERTVYHISDTVYHFYVKLGFSDAYFHRLIRHELRFGRHYRPARSALRHLVNRPLSVILILNIRQYNTVEKPLYKRRLSRPHGSNDTYVYVASRPFCYISVNRVILHIDPFRRKATTQICFHTSICKMTKLYDILVKKRDSLLKLRPFYTIIKLYIIPKYLRDIKNEKANSTYFSDNNASGRIPACDKRNFGGGREYT